MTKSLMKLLPTIQILPKRFNSYQSKPLGNSVAIASLSLQILSEAFLAEQIFQKKKKKSGNNIKNCYSYTTMNPFLSERTLYPF